MLVCKHLRWSDLLLFLVKYYMCSVLINQTVLLVISF
ncbi:unnamed protein product [Acanthoscelides obtectus]|uniref:Uncharacterized protein n=1 Tax=Acanthoscelides obtectus TaxID=200917 RepID=A0A9P0LV37_ACAOB|nr:unnamed protein product [Acanthoscelides obtectus]CAK1631023.1 hypothetical protein AOBTE_LOCUS6711 [Acanthoscelides obtectus]